MDHSLREQRKRFPAETANIFSYLTFAYTGSLFKKALKNDLEDKDLYDVLTGLRSTKCGGHLEKEWILESKRKSSPSLSRVLWKCFGWRYLFLGCMIFTWKTIKNTMEPRLMSSLISYFKPDQTSITKNDAWLYAGGIIFIALFHIVFLHNYILSVHRFGIEIKTSFSSMLYRKSLKLTPAVISSITLGNIVTLITKDVHVFLQSIWIINDMWTGALQVCYISYLLYSKVGSFTVIGISILLSALPIQGILSVFAGKLRLASGKKTDERLQVTQEVLSSIRIIKMYTWEDYFKDKINLARFIEVNKLVKGVNIKIFLLIIGVLFCKLSFCTILLSYTWLGYATDAEIVFYIWTIFKDINTIMSDSLPWSLGKSSDLYSAVTRIKRVLEAEELHPDRANDEETSNPVVEMKEACVTIGNFELLKNVSFSTNSGLTLVTGAVGSGKSTFLKAILQDYPLDSGHLVTRGRISYASQDPWLFPSSIRQNILFGQQFDQKRYAEVVRVCALEYDFSLFDKGDETIVTDRGSNLSKGQQARINLARAIYRESEIYLLDDSLTALDTHVQDSIFNECIKKYLKGKICILVTQTASHLQEADIIVVMSSGQIQYSGKPNSKLLDEITKVVVEDDDLEKEIIEENHLEANGGEDKTTEKSKLLETETKKKVYEEVNRKGEVSFSAYKKYITSGGGFMIIFGTIILFCLAQFSTSYSDKLLTKWVDDRYHVIELHKFINSTQLNVSQNLETAKVEEDYTLKLYTVMTLTAFILNTLKAYCSYEFCKRASKKIHKEMVTGTVYAVMKFFDTHFIGNILNRFSQDLNNIDEHLPYAICECLRVTLSVSGIVFLVVVVNPYFLIYALLFFGVLLILRKLYLPAGRSLKRLEAATRSPMIGHLNATLEGLTTIRACKTQEILINEFDKHQDLFTSAHYTSVCMSRAFGFLIDICCSMFIASVVMSFLINDRDTSAGNVGLALTQVFLLALHVQWGIRQWSELENLMTSVERVLEYTEIEMESKSGVEMENWPKEGAVTFNNVSLTYNDHEKVLNNLSFEIAPKQKIGIVGRTGAGKSSIISSLFRLYEVKGNILIDDVDIKNLSLTYLRKHVSIIPQDPVLFTGSIRTNLDPLEEFSDTDLWNALEKVNIKEAFPTLNFAITGHSNNFSSGQKQLICLARAILRKNKIVVLDEATANMDHETDTLLHNTIKENFSDCTVFTIAHRLHSILECDKVIVLDRGEIRECDEPLVLLENKRGMFYKMVEHAGLLNYPS